MKKKNLHRPVPTLEDVALAAGLSAMTVSRAINKPQQVRPKTVEKVLAAVKSVGYIPNALAGGLASRRSRLIAVVVPQINNAMFVDTIQALNDALFRQGYSMLLCVSGYGQEEEAEIVATLLSRRPDGLVLTGIFHSSALRKVILQTGIPVVEIWDMTPTPLDMLVGFSHEKVGFQTGLWLAKKGYHHPALVWTDDVRALQRRRGLEEALHQQGITIAESVTVSLPAVMQAGRQAFASIVQQIQSDIIVCSSDTLAQGVLIEAQSRNMSVPDEVAVMGFGDLTFAAWHHPAITTVRIDRQGIGLRAAEALVQRLAGNMQTPATVDVGFDIVERDSA